MCRRRKLAALAVAKAASNAPSRARAMLASLLASRRTAPAALLARRLARPLSGPAGPAFSELTALSGVDGRYAGKVGGLRPIFSEYGLIRHRVLVEVRWLQQLSRLPEVPEVPALSAEDSAALDAVCDGFCEADALRVKEIERTTNHDVKAVEYFIKERASESSPSLAAKAEFFHFACTSEDINNLAYGLMLRRAREEVVLPEMDAVLAAVRAVAREHADTPMLAPHPGQPATPTTLGKEMANFVHRLERQRDQFSRVEITGKFNGAVGCYNAHVAAYPDADWPALARRFVEDGLGLEFSPYDADRAARHDRGALRRGQAVQLRTAGPRPRRLGYVSQGWFRQRAVEGEIGSSTMPHKVNPIDFEQANLGLANAVMAHLSEAAVSRLLGPSDSTVLRSVSVGLAHSVVRTGRACGASGASTPTAGGCRRRSTTTGRCSPSRSGR